MGAFALASHLRTSLALLRSAGNVSEVVVASLLAFNCALALASRDRQELAPWRTEIFSQSETILVSHKTKSRDLALASHETELDFLIQIALAEAVLGSYEAFLILHET